MRLSVLALFIALPAAAYAAVTPQGQQGQPAQTNPKTPTADNCIPESSLCGNGGTCCGSFVCTPNKEKPDTLVCFMAHLLWSKLSTKLNADM